MSDTKRDTIMKKNIKNTKNAKDKRINARKNETNSTDSDGSDSDNGATNKTLENMDIEDRYDGKTLHEHILSIPDTYIGTVDVDEVKMFIFDEDREKIIEEVISYIAGFFKIFDEILVNARDHTVRDPTCKNISVKINKETGKISVWNDGNGIQVKIHKKYGIYLPQMIFGQLLTSENYGKKGKTVGGKNGYGAKLANVYSKEFIVHTVGMDDNDKKAEYLQVFRNNMYEIEEPKITNNLKKDAKTFTEITYLPDYERFGMTGMTNDMYNLLIKRCYDVAACTPSKVKITINDKEIKCRDFKDYIKLYYDESLKPKIVYEKINSRWEVGIGFNINFGDKYISFVNGISTFQGGTHVNHVVNEIVRRVTEHINKSKDHKNLKISPATIKQYLSFYINCVIEDPSFNSQTKERLQSKKEKWCIHDGSKCEDVTCEFNDKFIEDLCKTGLMTEVIKMSEFKEERELKKSDGKKTKKIKNIDGYVAARNAGTKKSHEACLFLTEGDSARAFAISGISVIGNDNYGVYPLKGKVLNVRKVKTNLKKLAGNQEFCDIKKIIGLVQGFRYKDVSKLNYGSVIIMTDQDPDGSHIKGLVINMFETFWPELLQIDGFIKSYNTPIVKTWKTTNKNKNNVKNFYSVGDYEKFVHETLKDDTRGWEHKYYKGLGTSDHGEAVDSFNNFEDNLMTFKWEQSENIGDDDSEQNDDEKQNNNATNKKKNKSDDEKTDDSDEKIDEYIRSDSHKAIKKAFDTNDVNLRKEWLIKFNKNNGLDYKPKMMVPYSDFIDKELIFFSVYDNERSIPSMADGFKPSQRKIMYAMFKRGRKAKEVKVAQVAGYISETTAYHHGEISLQNTIIGLARNFPGSNNISLLKPNGNFGYRRQGGADAASPRYIFTQVDSITNTIFREEDDDILDHNYDDGMKIEPMTFAPIVPIVLINGAEGIGTGFSLTIYPYNPKDVIANTKRMISGQKPIDMVPWYNGFRGTIEKHSKIDNKFIVKGKYAVNGNKVHITDIPIVNGWIEKYEKEMESRESVSKDDKLIIDEFYSKTDNNFVDMTITFKGQELQKLLKEDTLDNFLMMTQNKTVSNLHMFNADGKLVKYDSINHIFYEFYAYRLKMYEKRKEHILKKLLNDVDIYKYRVKFIKEYLQDKIVMKGKRTEDVINQLTERNYPKMVISDYRNEHAKSYSYLTEMSIISMTVDKMEELEKKIEKCKAIYDEYITTDVKDIWLKELDEFSNAYDVWLEEWNTKTNAGGNKGKEKTKGKKNKKDNDNDIDNDIDNDNDDDSNAKVVKNVKTVKKTKVVKAKNVNNK
jgi:DNA topoisomerase-2